MDLDCLCGIGECLVEFYSLDNFVDCRAVFCEVFFVIGAECLTRRDRVEYIGKG